MSKKTSVNTIVTVGGSGAALLLVAYTVASYFWLDRPIPGCMADYQKTATFDLTGSDGNLLSPIELQARAGNGERGVTENARIVAVSGGPGPAALEVKLGLADPGDERATPGIGFTWRPAASERASAACMRYSVWLPDDFDYAKGGNLPGFIGGELPAAGEKITNGVDLRTRWHREGLTDFSLRAPLVETSTGQSIGYRTATLPRGRWSTIEQELKLNSPGKKDGVLRVWKDGALAVETKRLVMREDDSIHIDGVAANIGFALTPTRQLPSGQPGTLRLSPIEMAWR
jgi:hypothetical protein